MTLKLFGQQNSQTIEMARMLGTLPVLHPICLAPYLSFNIARESIWHLAIRSPGNMSKEPIKPEMIANIVRKVTRLPVPMVESCLLDRNSLADVVNWSCAETIPNSSV